MRADLLIRYAEGHPLPAYLPIPRLHKQPSKPRISSAFRSRGILMPISENPTRLTLSLNASDAADVEALNQQLQQELRELDEATFELARTEAPTGAKSGLTPIDWTTLFVTLAASGGVLTTLVNLIQSKLTKDRSVTLEIGGDKLTVTGISSEDQKRLIDDWLKRRQKPKKAHG